MENIKEDHQPFPYDETGWGAQLMASTGPAQYNIRKRFLVKRKGLKLSEYGLFNRDSGEYILVEQRVISMFH